MPLKIDLKPGEKFIVNGAVLTVGKDGRSLVLQNEAVLLRDRDIIQEEDANTPAKRIYFSIMLMYIDPGNQETHRAFYQQYVHDLMETTGLGEVKRALLSIVMDVSVGNYYRAMKTCRALIALEAELLSMAPAVDLDDIPSQEGA